MHRFTSSIRRPVRREGAGHYLLITLLSFAASITLTRLFLALTGYPQLGGGEFHIAHVLWGGLLLYLAALLPLVLSNRWVYTLGAILGGAGVGLFIDEVGKFITSENDYFYPLAAPIIYALFLLTALLYSRFRRERLRDPRVELYKSLDAMEEVLEHDLDKSERAELVVRLMFVIEASDSPAQAGLARQLLNYLNSDAIQLAQERQTTIERYLYRFQSYESHWVTALRLKVVITIGLLFLGIIAFSRILLTLLTEPETDSITLLIKHLIETGQANFPTADTNWFLARIILESTIGLLLLVSAGLLIARRDSYGTMFGYWSLLFSLTTVDLLIFYFDQFSTILVALVQFTLLLLVSYYRKRYVMTHSAPKVTGV